MMLVRVGRAAGRRGLLATNQIFLSKAARIQNQSSSSNAVRCVSSASSNNKKDEDNEEPVKETAGEGSGTTDVNQVQDLIDSSARGIGQVIFLNSPLSGGILLTGWAISNPILAGLGCLGVITATATSRHVYAVDSSSWKDGLFGYNGALVGCAAGASLLVGPTSSITTGVAATVFGASVTPLVQSKLSQHVITKSPQWTYAFNFVTLSMLGAANSLTALSDSSNGGSNGEVDTATIDTITAAAAVTTTTPWMDVLVATPLVGISQIFLVESAVSGSLITAGIATYSPGLAVHAIMGSAIGSAIGVGLWDVPLTDITNGLWGYNSALSSMAVGVFWTHSASTVALSATSAGLTAVLFGAVSSSQLMGDLPCFTLPFCITMTATHIVMRNAAVDGSKGIVPTLADAPHSPEQNTTKIGE